MEGSIFKTYSEKVIGRLYIHENSQYNEVDVAQVTVAKNVTARLFGVVGDVILHKNSVIYIHGKIEGEVVNEGGELQVFSPEVSEKDPG